LSPGVQIEIIGVVVKMPPDPNEPAPEPDEPAEPGDGDENATPRSDRKPKPFYVLLH